MPGLPENLLIFNIFIFLGLLNIDRFFLLLVGYLINK